MKNVFPELLPKVKKLAETILALHNIDLAEKEVHSVTREERKKLVKK